MTKGPAVRCEPVHGALVDGTDVRAAPVPRGGAGGWRRGKVVRRVGAPAHGGRVRGVDPRREWCDMGDLPLASCWIGCVPRNRFDRIRSAPGVPGADRSWGDRAAVPCRPVTHAGARSHGVPAVRHTLQRSHAWFLPEPPLAGTDTGTNEATEVPVTRRTGESRSELGYASGAPSAAARQACGWVARGRPAGSHTRPRHSSSSVIASEVPGLPSAFRYWPRISISRERLTRRPPEVIRAS